MDAYTRETVVERRQLVVHWSAVFAGALVAAGVGVPLHLLGANIAWSVIACIAALFVGGYAASRLSQTRDRTVAATHAALAWAVVAVFGAAVMAFTAGPRGVAWPEREADLEVALAPVNAHQRELGKPAVTPYQIIEVSRDLDPEQVDQNKLADRLAATTTLTHAEALAVAQRIDSDVIERATRLDVEDAIDYRLQRARCRANLGAGLALLFGLAGALIGSMAALKRGLRPRVRVEHTAPYPAVHDTATYGAVPRDTDRY